MPTRPSTECQLTDTIANLLEDLDRSLNRLPDVNDAAKLRTLAKRITNAIADGQLPQEAALELEVAADDMRGKDPWFLVHGVAQRLRRALQGVARRRHSL